MSQAGRQWKAKRRAAQLAVCVLVCLSGCVSTRGPTSAEISEMRHGGASGRWITELGAVTVSNVSLTASTSDEVVSFLTRQISGYCLKNPEFSIIVAASPTPCSVQVKEQSVPFLALVDEVCRQANLRWSLGRLALVIEDPMAVRTPTKSGRKLTTARPIVCCLDNSGGVTVEGKAQTITRLHILLMRRHQESPDVGVIVRAASACKWIDVARVLAACYACGITEVSATVESDNKKSGQPPAGGDGKPAPQS